MIFRYELATVMRLGMSTKTPADLDKALKDVWTSAYPWIEVKSVKAEYDDATNVERITMDGAARLGWPLNPTFGAREVEVEDSQLGGNVSFKRDVGAADAPYAVAFPVFVKSFETIVLPQGGKGFSVVGEDVDKSVAGVAYKRASRIDGGVFTMEASARSLTTGISASEAAAAKPILREMSDVTVKVRAPVGYADGDKELQMRLARTPQLASEYEDRAGARTTKGDYAGAIKDYDQAIELKPDDSELLNDRCFTRGIANTDLPKALDDCNAAVALNPHVAAYLDSRGFVFFRMGQLAQAMSDYNAVLEIDPKVAATLYVKGLAERRLGDAQHAAADISAAKALDSSVVQTYAKYGVSQ